MNALALFRPVATRRNIVFTLVLAAPVTKTRARRRLLCRWRKDPLTGRLVCSWSSEDADARAEPPIGALRLAA
jgi:hypothetical protein